MVLGLLLIAMFSGAVVTVALIFTSTPVWIALMAYPVTGTIVMLTGLAGVNVLGRLGGVSSTPAHCPVQRSTTPTVATSTLTSVVNDNVRS
jgi:hypothetical protein